MMNDEERSELRALLVEVIGSACANLHEQLGSQIAEGQEVVGTVCDQLEVIESDVAAMRRQLARSLRERETDRSNLTAVTRRVRELERRGAGDQ